MADEKKARTATEYLKDIPEADRLRVITGKHFGPPGTIAVVTRDGRKGYVKPDPAPRAAGSPAGKE
jgi:hypothetical protein